MKPKITNSIQLKAFIFFILYSISTNIFANAVSVADTIRSNNLDWLRWDLTVGYSVDTALADFGSSGWRLATESEMAGMVNSFLLDSNSSYENDMYEVNYDYQPFYGFDDDDSTTETLWSPSSSLYRNSDLFGLFGITGSDHPNPCDDSMDGCWTISSAIYGDDKNGNGLYSFIEMSETLWDDNSEQMLRLQSDAINASFTINKRFKSSRPVGIALVKDVSPVPIPSTLSLLLSFLAIGGLVKLSRTSRSV